MKRPPTTRSPQVRMSQRSKNMRLGTAVLQGREGRDRTAEVLASLLEVPVLIERGAPRRQKHDVSRRCAFEPGADGSRYRAAVEGGRGVPEALPHGGRRLTHE